MDVQNKPTSVETRPWYRVLGYRSAHSLRLIAGVLVFLLIDKALERELGTWEGLLILFVVAGIVGLAIWDYVDWRKEKRAAGEAPTKKSTT